MTVSGQLMDGGQNGATGTAVLNVRGSGYLQQQNGNQFYVTNGTAATHGIVNLLTGGTLEANQILANGGTFDDQFRRRHAPRLCKQRRRQLLQRFDQRLRLSGRSEPGRQRQERHHRPGPDSPHRLWPGASGSTLSVPNGGGSGYIAPPVVTFSAPASGGVPATGVATMSGTDGTGTVTGIIITSPGSGYGNGDSVTATFNGNDTTSGADVAAAGSFTLTATSQNAASGGLTVIGNGTLTLSSTANAYGGPTTVTAGTLTGGAANVLPAGNSLILGGADSSGVFNLGGYNQQVGGLAMAGGTATITNNGASDAALVFSGGAASTFAGAIKSGATNKTALTVSAGSLTLAGVNSYTGATTVNAGLLALSNAAANNIAFSSTITVASGATLDTTGLNGGAGLTLTAGQTLAGAGVVSGPLTTVNGSTIAPGMGGADRHADDEQSEPSRRLVRDLRARRTRRRHARNRQPDQRRRQPHPAQQRTEIEHPGQRRQQRPGRPGERPLRTLRLHGKFERFQCGEHVPRTARLDLHVFQPGGPDRRDDLRPDPDLVRPDGRQRGR